MPEIILPQLGYATTEATILRWLKAPGDPVNAGDALLEVASEKTVHVVVAAAEGVVLATDAPPGAIVPEGEPIGWIGREGEQPPAPRFRLTGWEEAVAPPPDDLETLLQRGRTEPARPTRDGGTLPQGIERAFRPVLRSQLRRVTAQRMAHSWAQAPKVDLFADVEFTRIREHRRALKAAGHEPPSYNVYIAQAAVKALGDFPQYNVHYRDGQAVPLDAIHVGIAVALGDNLVTVSLRDLAGAGVLEIQRRFKGLIRKALQMNLSRDELYGSSLTVTNLGEWDVTAFTAVINPPEVFILAVGKVEERAVVRDGAVVPRTMCTFVLSFDHRAIDGAPASKLLQRIKQYAEGEQDPLPTAEG